MFLGRGIYGLEIPRFFCCYGKCGYLWVIKLFANETELETRYDDIPPACGAY